MQSLMAKHEEGLNNNILNGGNSKYVAHEGADNKQQAPHAHNTILQSN